MTAAQDRPTVLDYLMRIWPNATVIDGGDAEGECE
jgi:hypothetical protein